MKTIWAILLGLLLAAPVTVPAQFSFTTNDDGTLTITGYTGPGGIVTVPASIDGQTVSTIGDGEDSVFAGTGVTFATIPEGVTSIATNACADSELISVIIPGTAASLGDAAFADCLTLTNVYLNGNAPIADLTVFENDTNATVYYLDGTTGWTITDSSTNFAGLPAVDSTPGDQFEYSTNDGTIDITNYIGPTFSDVIIPDAIDGMLVTSIGGPGAFLSSESPNSVSIPASVNCIQAYAFSSGWFGYILGYVNIAYGVTSIGDGAFEGLNIGSIIIPDSVTNLGVNAFAGSYLYGTFTIPGTVTSIPDSAFYSCFILGGVVIEPGVTSIGDNAFSQCERLFSVSIPYGVTNIGSVAFDDCSLDSVEIPGSVINIGDYAFCASDGYGTGKVTINYGVANIGAYAFAFSYIQSVEIPGSVTNIGGGAFTGCIFLSSVTFDYGVANIGAGAFDLSGLEGSITIPASVTNIGDGAFTDNPDVTSIYFTGNAPAADYSAFVGYESSNIPTAYYLPGTSGWGPTYAGIPALPWGGDFTYATNAGSISISSYYGDDGTVYIPTTINGLPVTSIGSGAFVGCTNLVNITIPDNVTNIADAAFQDCDNLASIYFTGNAPAADPSAFEDSTNGITPTVYYLPGASGWSSTFAGFPAVLWNPQIQTTGTNFGVSGNQFGFNITGTNNFTALVETSTNLAGPVWSVLQTVTLVNGSYSFTDPQWTNYPGRYYTLVMP